MPIVTRVTERMSKQTNKQSIKQDTDGVIGSSLFSWTRNNNAIFTYETWIWRYEGHPFLAYQLCQQESYEFQVMQQLKIQ